MAGEAIEGLRPLRTLTPLSNRATFGGPGLQPQNVKTKHGQTVIESVIATNEVLYTGNFNVYPWQKTASVQLTTYPGPSPGQDSQLIYSVVGGEYVQQEVGTFVAGSNIWFSCWFKAYNSTASVTLEIDVYSGAFLELYGYSDYGDILYSEDFFSGSTPASYTLDCDVVDEWQMFAFKQALTADSLVRIKIIFNSDDVYAFNPQVVYATNRFPMSIVSGSTKGQYTKLSRVQLFTLYEDESGSAMWEDLDLGDPLLEDI
jgi:hypothetical protein